MVKPDYDNQDSKFSGTSDKFITVFTDGSYCPKSGAWGVAIWIKYAGYKPRIISYGNKGCPNVLNSGEVEKIALKKVKKVLNKEYDLHGKILVIQSDCLPALNDISFKDLEQNGLVYIKKKHVKAHTNNKTKRTAVNRLVDKIAKDEMRKYRWLI